MRRALRVAAASAVVLVLAFFALGAGIERLLNRVPAGDGPAPSAAARALHREAFVADLHADSLLWGRDLTRHGEVGHVDFPRLRRGGAALQAFTVVTRVPWTINVESNPSDAFDLVTLLAIAHGWPRATWSSRLERALAQARRLDALAAEDGKVRRVRSTRDLADLAAEHERDPEVIGAFLGLEGAHALEGDVDNLERLVDAGFRMIGLVHFFDNGFAGSAHGEEKSGLTSAGRELVRRMERRGVIVDLAHASAATIDEVLAVATRPVVVSHTGLRATCPGPRNLSDAQIRGVAATGGVVAIGFWETAVCGRSVEDVVRAVVHAIDQIGDGHVALGSDFDGAVWTVVDAAALPRITEALLRAGIGEASIAKVIGGNVRRVLGETLP